MNLDDLARDPAQADTLSPSEAKLMLWRLVSAMAALTKRLDVPEPPKEESKLITKAEAIRRMKAAGIPASDSTWHREQHKYQSFIRRMGKNGRMVMCSEVALERYIREHSK